MADLASDSNPDDIDYMHPEGKPQKVASDAQTDAKPSWQELRIAMEEADGHYMPSRDPYLQELKEPEDSHE
ncbi:MAG TPA: hypothetical protein V6D22_12890 [Candidatus Obscuribacterales bacterium]